MILSKDSKTSHTQDILSDLYRLIEALDRRVPRLERLGAEVDVTYRDGPR